MFVCLDIICEDIVGNNIMLNVVIECFLAFHRIVFVLDKNLFDLYVNV